jgi:hypothetical protein
VRSSLLSRSRCRRSHVLQLGSIDPSRIHTFVQDAHCHAHAFQTLRAKVFPLLGADLLRVRPSLCFLLHVLLFFTTYFCLLAFGSILLIAMLCRQTAHMCAKSTIFSYGYLARHTEATGGTILSYAGVSTRFQHLRTYWRYKSISLLKRSIRQVYVAVRIHNKRT